MARREDLDMFIKDVIKHAKENPRELPAVLFASMVDPDTGRVWCRHDVLVADTVVNDVFDAIEHGEVEEIKLDPVNSNSKNQG